jgi:voltage-gated potassium channel
MPHPTALDLEHIALFRTLTLGQLAELSEHLEVEDVEPGDVLLREGEPGDTLYLLRIGVLEATVAGRRLGRIRGGDFFGELALHIDGRRHATVTAVEKGTVYRMSALAFDQLKARHAEIAAAVQDTAAMRELASL